MSFCLLSLKSYIFLFLPFPQSTESLAEDLKIQWRFLHLPPTPRLSLAVNYFVAGKVSKHKYSLPFTAAVMSLGLDLSMLLSDLAAHSSESSALQAPSCCSSQGSASVVAWTLLFPRVGAYLLLGRAWWGFPSFGWWWLSVSLGLLSIQHSPYLVCSAAAHRRCWDSGHPRRCAASTPSLPWLLERKDCLCLHNAFHVQNP